MITRIAPTVKSWGELTTHAVGGLRQQTIVNVKINKHFVEVSWKSFTITSGD